jgi:hypothetical protein
LTEDEGNPHASNLNRKGLSRLLREVDSSKILVSSFSEFSDTSLDLSKNESPDKSERFTATDTFFTRKLKENRKITAIFLNNDPLIHSNRQHKIRCHSLQRNQVADLVQCNLFNQEIEEVKRLVSVSEFNLCLV